MSILKIQGIALKYLDLHRLLSNWAPGNSGLSTPRGHCRLPSPYMSPVWLPWASELATLVLCSVAVRGKASDYKLEVIHDDIERRWEQRANFGERAGKKMGRGVRGRFG